MAENIFECVRDVTPQRRSSSELAKSLDLGQESATSGTLQYICTTIESFDLTSDYQIFKKSSAAILIVSITQK